VAITSISGYYICEGGNHIDVAVTDSGVSRIVSFTLDELKAECTEEEIAMYLRIGAKLYYRDLEKLQIADVVKYDIAVREDILAGA